MATAPQTASTTAAGESSGKATASLVLGIFGLVLIIIPIAGLILGILATAFGSTAKSEIKRRGMSGLGKANAGFVLGIIAIVLSVAFFILGVAAQM
ncbi:MAG TPA: DUF4190 domain-containing protein [Solirubrobacteraceae bacterium]|jgi:hypothetical protein